MGTFTSRRKGRAPRVGLSSIRGLAKRAGTAGSSGSRDKGSSSVPSTISLFPGESLSRCPCRRAIGKHCWG